MASVWGGRIVADSTLSSRINAARKAVGDSGGEQRLIRTIARKGIRFVGDVQSGQRRRRVAARPSVCHGVASRAARPALPRSDKPAIAVLPFVNMSGELEQEYFSDGISEDIITALSKLRWFFVIARNSSFIYKGKSVHIKKIAEELGVGYVVEGSVRKEGERVRITAQLNDASTGSHLWAERYDRDLADVFAVQDEITEAIVATIEPQLYAAENFRAQRKARESLDAWDLVMRALDALLAGDPRGQCRDPGAAREGNRHRSELRAGARVLAVSDTFGARMGWEDAETARPAAERAALAAVQADGEDPWAHLALACARGYRDRLEDSLAAFEQALRLNPNFALAQGYYGLVLSWTGRWREGAEAARRALRLSPHDRFAAIYNGVAAYAAYVERDYDEAIRLARMGSSQRNDFPGAYRVITAAAAMAGEMDLLVE